MDFLTPKATVRAKGDFCEKITLEHDAHPQIIRALKGRTDFFG
jgi:hypothetical protein